MAFCRKCGARISDDSRFCTVCGTAVDQEFIRPKVYGRGLAIASLILSIVGLVAGFGMMMASIMADPDSMKLTFTMLYYPIPLLATCFAIASRKKGYVYGISRTGLIMGAIGLSMLTLAIFITLVGLA